MFLSGSCGIDRSSTINERPDSVILGQLAVPQGGRRGRDRMVVGLTTTYAISVYHYLTFFSDLRQVNGFPRALQFPLAKL